MTWEMLQEPAGVWCRNRTALCNMPEWEDTALFYHKEAITRSAEMKAQATVPLISTHYQFRDTKYSDNGRVHLRNLGVRTELYCSVQSAAKVLPPHLS